MNFIRNSKAVTYNDLLNEAIVLKKKELEERGGKPFYEPSTFYREFKEAYYHDDYQYAASRYASTHYSTYERFKKHHSKAKRLVPGPSEDHLDV